MSKFNHRTLLAAFAGLVLSFGVGSASADTITYTLNAFNSGGVAGPFGTVEVNRTSTTTAIVTFTAASGFKFTDGSSAAVNVNASSFTLTNVVDNGTFLQVKNPPGTSNVDGFGSFNGVIDNENSFNGSATSISFTLTNTSGTWASASTVLLANNTGNVVAAHIGVCNTGCTAFSQTGFTAVVPIPAAAWLFGSGLIGLIGIARRRITASQAPAIA
jgi:hypothetical protein